MLYPLKPETEKPRHTCSMRGGGTVSASGGPRRAGAACRVVPHTYSHVGEGSLSLSWKRSLVRILTGPTLASPPNITTVSAWVTQRDRPSRAGGRQATWISSHRGGSDSRCSRHVSLSTRPEKSHPPKMSICEFLSVQAPCQERAGGMGPTHVTCEGTKVRGNSSDRRRGFILGHPLISKRAPALLRLLTRGLAADGQENDDGMRYHTDC